MPTKAHQSTIYSTADLDAIRAQIRRRWLAIGAPCAVLLVVLILSVMFRVEAVTTISTILIGGILILCWDLFIKPLDCYRKHLEGVLYGLQHEAVLPFIALSEDVNMVDGVACHALTCSDTDAKGRPYERLFYFDAEKTFPTFTAGEMVRITHHDLIVTDVVRA